MATLQQIERDAKKVKEQRKREAWRRDQREDAEKTSRRIFERKTCTLHPSHPTYKEEKRKHDIRLGEIRKRYPV